MKDLPISQTVYTEEELCDAGPLALSFVGDGVHTLFVRTLEFPQETYKNGRLHALASKEVCAERQAELAKKMEPFLTEKERYIFKKAKSAKVHTAPAHATLYQYNLATAFEAVIGYLYLGGKNERLAELLEKVYSEDI